MSLKSRSPSSSNWRSGVVVPWNNSVVDDTFFFQLTAKFRLLLLDLFKAKVATDDGSFSIKLWSNQTIKEQALGIQWDLSNQYYLSHFMMKWNRLIWWGFISSVYIFVYCMSNSSTTNIWQRLNAKRFHLVNGVYKVTEILRLGDGKPSKQNCSVFC